VWSARQQIGVTPPVEAGPLMKEALTRAAALDDGLPEVHLGLANAYTWTDWNWPAGEAEFKKALSLRPGYGEAHAFYAHYLFIMRRPDEAVGELNRALELDPLSDLILGLCGQGFLMARRFDDALRTFRTALDTAPRSSVALNGYARALYLAGRYDEAIEFEKQVWTVRNDREVVEALDRGYATRDYHAAYRAAADTLASRWKAGQKSVNPNAIVALYLRADQPDRVFDWVDIAIATRDPNVPYVGAGPNWDSLRRDPRLQAVQEKLKLPK
jgi:tetratricopeptide (TPR) repeat protein